MRFSPCARKDFRCPPALRFGQPERVRFHLLSRRFTRIFFGLPLTVLGLAAILDRAAPNARAGASAAAPAPVSRQRFIQVVSHGWHTGIIVRRADIPPGCGWPALPEFAREEYLEVGWGSREFYMARRFTLPLVLRTVLTATPSAVHVAGFRGPSDAGTPRSESLRLAISAPGLRALCEQIGKTFSRDAQGRVLDLGPGLYGHSRFYRANGLYSLPNNCNPWTARVLRAAGYPVRGPSSLTSGGVMAQLRPLAPARAAALAGRSESRRSGRGRPAPRCR